MDFSRNPHRPESCTTRSMIDLELSVLSSEGAEDSVVRPPRSRPPPVSSGHPSSGYTRHSHGSPAIPPAHPVPQGDSRSFPTEESFTQLPCRQQGDCLHALLQATPAILLKERLLEWVRALAGSEVAAAPAAMGSSSSGGSARGKSSVDEGVKTYAVDFSRLIC